MEMNVDLLIAGCNTRCRHCYVNGGPGKCMALEDALLCIRRLDALAAMLAFPVSFTLDNEPMNHPELPAILRAAAGAGHMNHFHHGMTTGIALMARPDRNAVVQAYRDAGCGEFGITLHGAAEHHDEIVRRKGGFAASVAAAEYLKNQGFAVSISLMFNRFFRTDARELSRTIKALEPDFIYFALPIYSPHPRMAEFEPYRGGLSDIRDLSRWLGEWRQDPEDTVCRAEQSTPGAVLRFLEQGRTVRELFAEKQEELYLTVHGDRFLYMGNTGAETLCLGDLRTLDLARAAEIIRNAPGNRDYGAFYALDCLPEEETIRSALRRLPPDRVFGDRPSVICRALEELGTPTRLLKTADE